MKLKASSALGLCASISVKFAKLASSAMDVHFVSHGSPMMPFDDIPAREFLRNFPKLLAAKPKAILVVSAHWDTRDPIVSTTRQNSTIYDFYGFPRELYQLKYNAPGAPEVARKALQLLKAAGFSKSSEDSARGLDHGAWVPLWLAYPQVNIPVCQVSIQSHRDAAYHYKLGQALEPLRHEGVLILASGTTTHNLRQIVPTTPAWAKSFDDWLYDCLLHGRYEDVINFVEKAPHAKMNHPTPDHFLPLLVAMGAAGEGSQAKAAHRSFQGSFSMTSYAFTSGKSSREEL